jgi:hypothetical protein
MKSKKPGKPGFLQYLNNYQLMILLVDLFFPE